MKDEFMKRQSDLEQAGAAMGQIYQSIVPALAKAYKEAIEQGFNEIQAYGLTCMMLAGFLQQMRESREGEQK